MTAVELAATTRRLYELGWMRGTSGNVSVRTQLEPPQLLVSASGFSKYQAGVEHAVMTDEFGIAIDGQSHKPSAEAAVHAAIISEVGAGAVVHVHALASVLAAARWPDGVVLRDLEQLKGLGRSAENDDVRFPVVANSQDMAVLSEDIRRAIDPRTPAVLVGGHGMYVWGADLEDAANRTESVDWLLQWALMDPIMGSGANTKGIKT
jgi:methylthioribulose-1-phosphate dehydratase